MREHNTGASVFVKIDEYKEILDVMELLKSKLKEARSTLAKVETLRAQEEHEIRQWNSTIDDLDNKINSIDRNLFEPEG